ncbi:MAG: TRAP transporter small permease subunit [Gammaproteobacteria bacterium]|nr:TRAP transporter small permease subunit [Gammaproteobacteria bacterium]
MPLPLNTSLVQFAEIFVSTQNRLQQQFGHLVAWSALSLVFIMALVVILRYGFNTGSIALQEAVMYNHAFLFMLGIAYTYQQDKHVRVDVFYAQFSANTRAWINVIGSFVLTLPAMGFIIWSGWDYVAVSWRIQETSAEAGGIEYLYLLKSLILIMALLVISQALSVATQSVLALISGNPPYNTSEKRTSQQPIESTDLNEGKL